VSIPSSFPAGSHEAPGVTSTAATPPPAETKPTTETAPYVIKLTVAEQAFQLSLQEQSVPQIANRLSLTVAAVKSYLGITNAT
jgi:hypothetical protein